VLMRKLLPQHAVFTNTGEIVLPLYIIASRVRAFLLVYSL